MVTEITPETIQKKLLSRILSTESECSQSQVSTPVSHQFDVDGTSSVSQRTSDWVKSPQPPMIPNNLPPQHLQFSINQSGQIIALLRNILTETKRINSNDINRDEDPGSLPGLPGLASSKGSTDSTSSSDMASACVDQHQSKSAEGGPPYLTDEEIVLLRSKFEGSRSTFAMGLIKKIFTQQDLHGATIRATGFNRYKELDPCKMLWIRKVVFEHFPMPFGGNTAPKWRSIVKKLDTQLRRSGIRMKYKSLMETKSE